MCCREQIEDVLMCADGELMGVHCPHSLSALLAALAVVERWLVKVGCEDVDGGL